MPVIKTRTTYLEMFETPMTTVLPPRPDLDARKVCRPSVEFYRYLYRGVGSKWHWVDRLALSDDELEAIIHDDQVDLYVFIVAGETAGYSELDRRTENEIELAYFGLFPEFIGQGLGKYFSNWTMRKAWSFEPRRVWLHTCDLDHPAALPSYLKAGFEIYDEKVIDQVISEEK